MTLVSGLPDIGIIDTMIGFAQDQIHKSFHPIRALPRDAIKIAIVAFMKAEWNVNIKRRHRHGRQPLRRYRIFAA